MTAHNRSAEFNTAIAKHTSFNFALQGGGTHGAFTWGVLDRLLEEEELIFDGVTATSAGAINAVLLAYGLSVEGRKGARKALDLFWQKMSVMMKSSIIQPSALDKMSGNFGLDYSPGYVLLNLLCQFLSPYQFNPFNFNPLKRLLEEVVDFAQVRRQTSVRLFLCATNVRTCEVQIFPGRELTADHVLASSCLPFLMHAVRIDGEVYWDGGFIGNPALFPLIYECEATDIVLVQVTPAHREKLPVTTSSILSRLQEVSTSSSLLREMRAIAFVNKLISQGRMTGGKEIIVHKIEAAEAMSKLPHSSKLNCDWEFLLYLHNLGRRRAEDWLASTFDCLCDKATNRNSNFRLDLPKGDEDFDETTFRHQICHNGTDCLSGPTREKTVAGRPAT